MSDVILLLGFSHHLVEVLSTRVHSAGEPP